MSDIIPNSSVAAGADDSSDDGSSVVVLPPIPVVHDVVDLSHEDEQDDDEEEEEHNQQVNQQFLQAMVDYDDQQLEYEQQVQHQQEWENQELPANYGGFDDQVILMDEGGNIHEDHDDNIRDTIEERGLPMQQRKYWRGRYVNPSQQDLVRVAGIMREKRGPEARDLLGAVAVEIDYYFKPARNNWDYWHTSRPDLDNMVKFSLDAMQRAGFFADDCQVSRLVVQKTYCEHDEESRVEYRVYRL